MNKKILSSTAIIRFQDCDPFRHLNNGRYVDYMLNAREDQVRDAYGLKIYDLAVKEQLGWVVSTSQIAFLSPALPFEKVLLESQAIAYSPYNLMVEFRMFDEHRKQLKAFMWMDFVFIDLKKGKVTAHTPELMDLFETAILPVTEKDFGARRLALKNVWS
ncbi:MAG TPA: acyl-CoA thioesterase [Saprospiraceae bacterium]|nr:acyl-CoA thioesterase [Saprospiraceae bacterium]